MEPQILIFFGFFVLVVVLIIFGALASARRKKELSAWAQSKGLSFDPSHDGSFDDRFPSFDCLKQGSNRYAFNRMQGRWAERDFLGFDYHYETHSTNSKGHTQTHHHHFSAVILFSAFPLKPLSIRPESFFDKVTEFFGLDDIDFESAEFSRKFFVKAADKRWAYDVIHARTMEFLLESPRYSIQFDTQCAIVWNGRTFSAADYENPVKVLEGVLDLLPEYVVRQQREMG